MSDISQKEQEKQEYDNLVEIIDILCDYFQLPLKAIVSVMRFFCSSLRDRNSKINDVHEEHIIKIRKTLNKYVAKNLKQ